MKKKIILIIFIFLLVGCKNNLLTKEIFLERAEFNGYIIEKNKTGYEKYNYIKDIYYAINREDAYDIQFLILDDNAYAKRFFDLNQKELSSLADNDTYVKRLNKRNYNLYHIETSLKYMLVIRSENNILYIDAPIDYINEIEEFLEDMDLDY